MCLIHLTNNYIYSYPLSVSVSVSMSSVQRKQNKLKTKTKKDNLKNSPTIFPPFSCVVFPILTFSYSSVIYIYPYLYLLYISVRFRSMSFLFASFSSRFCLLHHIYGSVHRSIIIFTLSYCISAAFAAHCKIKFTAKQNDK